MGVGIGEPLGKRKSLTVMLRKATVPILFIHGDSDTFVPPFMVEKLYNAANCEKERLVIKGASHGACYWVDPKLYWDAIKTFIDKHI